MEDDVREIYEAINRLEDTLRKLKIQEIVQRIERLESFVVQLDKATSSALRAINGSLKQLKQFINGR